MSVIEHYFPIVICSNMGLGEENFSPHPLFFFIYIIISNINNTYIGGLYFVVCRVKFF
jgi:hypothetical protein